MAPKKSQANPNEGKPISAENAQLTTFTTQAGATISLGTPSSWTFSTATARPDRPLVLTLASGFYLLTAPTRGGKSLLAAALAFMMKESSVMGSTTYTPPSASEGAPEAAAPEVDYLALFEARVSMIAGRAPFTNASTFMKDYTGAPRPDATTFRLQGKQVHVLDSITAPLQVYNPDQVRASASAGKGGQTIADSLFVSDLQQRAQERDCIVIGVLNLNEVPFIDTLEARAEGVINVSHGALVVKARGTQGREPVRVALQERFLQRATLYLGYGEFDASRSASGTASRFGHNEH